MDCTNLRGPRADVGHGSDDAPPRGVTCAPVHTGVDDAWRDASIQRSHGAPNGARSWLSRGPGRVPGIQAWSEVGKSHVPKRVRLERRSGRGRTLTLSRPWSQAELDWSGKTLPRSRDASRYG